MIRKLFFPLPLIVGLFWFLWFRPLFLGGTASYIIVSGSSMEPTLYTGDLAVLQERDNYIEGDIVAFKVDGGIVIHRIVGGLASEGYLMQGDNKDSTDPWHPRPEHILGRMWFHIPGGGQPLLNLRQPGGLLALGGLAFLMIIGDLEPQKKNRKRGRRMKPGNRLTMSGFNAPSWAMTLLTTAGLLVLVFGAVAGYGFLQPQEREETVERLRYEHTAAFHYTVHTDPSILYPQETIGPVGPETSTQTGLASLISEDPGSVEATDDGSSATNAGPPVFTRLARSLDLDFNYQLSSPLPPDVKGEIRIDLQIKAGDGWTRTETLVQPAPFSGPVSEAHTTVDLREIQDFLKAVEEQTGFNPGTYEIALIPQVHITGNLGATPIDDSFAPPFIMQLNQTQIRLEPELARSEPKTVSDQVIRPNQLRLYGFSMSIMLLRLLGLAGLAICLAIAAPLAAVVFLGLGLDPGGRVQVRYGGQIVSVASADLGNAQRVAVASIRDLARLAQRDGKIIFHEEARPGAHLYFVPDGQVVYTYSAGETREFGEACAERSPS